MEKLERSRRSSSRSGPPRPCSTNALRLAGAAGAADVRVGLEIWPEMIHVWHLFHPALAAGGRAIAEGGAFIRAHLG